MPHTELKRMCLNRFATVLSKMSFTAAIFITVAAIMVIALPIVSALASLLLLLIKICLIAFTLGLILLVDGFGDSIENWENGIVNTEVLFDLLMKIAPYVLAVTMVLAVLSILLFAIDKRQRHTGRLTCNIISLTLAVILLVLYLVILWRF